ncbi:hypothetical protein A8950_2117 [Dongia mobilis]|uniref:Secreted protein n=1 Tax=Dongia mobilis TaxID=578943 RepID=A0A4R6WXH2_9PROT|nr:DUF1223 domain-containing protein [Dongia mobilis]TDQ82295.1 hypothetical protein A8950_2117 [Dongia mobilis]
MAGSCLGAIAAVALVAAAFTRPAVAADLTVVELFTSQGCSSCPPADANLGILAGQDGVLALSFGVTYWDSLGWADTFAQPAFTQRQRDYAVALGNSHVYTPQMLVDGRIELVGNRMGAIEAALDRAVVEKAAAVRPSRLVLGADSVTLGDGAGLPEGGAEVWLVRYTAGRVDIPVARGENGGRTLAITHAVRELAPLGTWTGAAITLPIPPGDPTLKRAILVQRKGPGAILAAVTD